MPPARRARRRPAAVTCAAQHAGDRDAIVAALAEVHPKARAIRLARLKPLDERVTLIGYAKASDRYADSRGAVLLHDRAALVVLRSGCERAALRAAPDPRVATALYLQGGHAALAAPSRHAVLAALNALKRRFPVGAEPSDRPRP